MSQQPHHPVWLTFALTIQPWGTMRRSNLGSQPYAEGPEIG